MFTTFARLWLPLKAFLSRALVGLTSRHPLPRFKDPESVARYMAEHLVYRSDPLGGALDYYTHPEAIQWEIESGQHLYCCDCDDFSLYAYVALKTVAGCEPRIVTLVDSRLKMSHVVCAFRDVDGTFGVIDTNGLYRWGHEAEGDEDELLKLRFGRLYRTIYESALTTRYPF